MLDYEALNAFVTVLETQSFQLAAQKLFITQSAISQRIKSLEKRYGEPILIRTTPYRPTSLGQRLLSHFKQVALLEEDFKTISSQPDESYRISIAISRDSLETWFREVINQLKLLPQITLEIIADDQEKTINYLRNGIVAACASTQSQALLGCKAKLIGYFDYVLVASPNFKRRYFDIKASEKKKFQHAPALLFDMNDTLPKQYLKHFFNMDDHDISYHQIPSVAGFRQFVLNGYAYALIPYIDIRTELKSGRLINLYPDKIWHMPIYWHTWDIETKFYKSFNQLICKVTQRILRQS